MMLALAMAAELVLIGGRIHTEDPARPEAQAVAIAHGRIVAVGSNAEVRALVGKQTQVIDLHGRRVVPGFRDSHVHFLDSGLGLSRVQLKDARDEADFGRRLREFDQKLPPGEWILGGDWDHDRAFNGRLPTAADLDQWVRDRPVFINRYDGHMALLNSKGMQLSGIDDKTADPAGGVVYRYPGSRKPTGLLRDNAMGLARVPDTTAAEIERGVDAALKEAARVGVTAVEDMDGSSPETRRQLFARYQSLARDGKLTCRIGLYWPLALWKTLADVGLRSGFGNDWVRIGGVKGFVDGSIGSSTAKLFEPYLNEPGSTGLYVTPPEALRKWITAADAAGLTVAVHAIGDRANAELLDIFAELSRKPGNHHFRIEHAQHLRAQDIPRFGQIGVAASVQPYHAIDDGRFVEGRIGAKRCATSYAWKSLLDAGAVVAFGSDWSVAPLSPILGIDAAVNRRTLDGKHPEGWFPEQKITVEQAIAAYTIGAARAAGRDRDEGSITPGKLADLVVLSRDILDPRERDHIAETQVVTTIAGGRAVYP